MSPPHQEIDASINKQDVQETVAERDDAVEQPQEVKEQPKEKPVKEAPKVEPISHPIGCENYRHLLAQYNWNVDVMLRVMKAESSCNPSAVGDDYPIRGLHAPSCGLMQIRTLAGRPSCAELKDPATNIAWAHSIYQGQGYRAWTVCRTVVNCE